MVNIIITNRDFSKVVFKKKAAILTRKLKRTLVRVIIIAEPVLSLVVLAKLAWSLIVLA